MSSLKPTLILTGANGGLGLGFIQNLLASPYAKTHHAIYTVRNLNSAGKLNKLLEAKAPKHHTWEVVALDLSSLAEVRRVAIDIKTRISTQTLGPMSALLLNAGFQEANNQTSEPKTYTPEGHEGHFGINHLSPSLLTLLLLSSMDKEHGRIVWVTSYMHNSYDERPKSMGIYEGTDKNGKLFKEMFESVEVWSKGKVYAEDDGYKGGMRRYGASKLAGVMFMYELQRRLLSTPSLKKISILSLDPGAMGGTSLLRDSPLFTRFLFSILGFMGPLFVYFNPDGTYRTTYKSGTDLLKAGFETKEPYGERPQGVYFDGGRRGESSKESRDEVKQAILWKGSLETLGVKEGDVGLGGGNVE